MCIRFCYSGNVKQSSVHSVFQLTKSSDFCLPTSQIHISLWTPNTKKQGIRCPSCWRASLTGYLAYPSPPASECEDGIWESTACFSAVSQSTVNITWLTALCTQQKKRHRDNTLCSTCMINENMSTERKETSRPHAPFFRELVWRFLASYSASAPFFSRASAPFSRELLS